MPDSIDFDALMILRNLAVALVVGFLIGFEREWTRVAEARQHSFAGARTFALIGLLGGLAGTLDDGLALPVAGLLIIAVLTTASYVVGAQSEGRKGGTTEVAIFATYLLGLAAAREFLLVSVVGGVVVAIVLSIKESVQRWATTFTEAEIHAALRFLAISIIILPVLPNVGYGPYESLNPREIWLMVVFISGLSFMGYWLTKALGADHGALLTGVVGGMASSTATTLSLAPFAKEGAARVGSVAAGIIAANVVMLVRVGFLLAAVARPVLAAVWPVLAVGAVIGAGASVLLWLRAKGSPKGAPTLELGNPMEIKPALIFAALLAVIAMASSYGADEFGEAGLYVVGLISGLADVDAMTLTAGRQSETGAVSALAAGGAIMTAVAVNIAVKGAMAASLGGRNLGTLVGGVFALVIATGIAVYFVLQT